MCGECGREISRKRNAFELYEKSVALLEIQFGLEMMHVGARCLGAFEGVPVCLRQPLHNSIHVPR
jgi:hypothetical protein